MTKRIITFILGSSVLARNMFFIILLILFLNPVKLFPQSITKGLKKDAKEIETLRTEISKTFINPDSSFTTIVANKPIHKKNSNNKWVDMPLSDITKDINNYGAGCIQKNDDNTYSRELVFGVGKNSFYHTTRRGFLCWSLLSLPSNLQTVTSASFDYFLPPSWNGNNRDFSLYSLENDPTLGFNYSQLYIDCGDGDLYSTETYTNQTEFSFYGGTAFKNNLKNSNNNGLRWIGVGFKMDDEDNANYYLQFFGLSVLSVTYPGGQNNDPILAVTPSFWYGFPEGGNQQITVSNIGNSTPIAFHVSKDMSWGNIGITSGNAPALFNLSVQPNFTGTIRNGTVTIIADNPNTIGSPKFVRIYQNPTATITLPDQQVSGLESYSATDWIRVNNFVVGANGNISNLYLNAVNSITLSPGFSVRSGANFTANVHFFDSPRLLEGDSKEIKAGINADKTGNSSNPEFNKNQIQLQIPEDFALSQNYPNPFNPSTLIKYALKENINVKITIYDILGQVVRTLVNDYQEAGYKSVVWDGTNDNNMSVASGVYIYRIEAGNFTDAKKMLIIK